MRPSGSRFYSRFRFWRRALHRFPVSSLFVLFLNSGGDLSVFCYRMGVDILSAGRNRVSFPLPTARIPVACSNLFSTFSTRFLSLKN